MVGLFETAVDELCTWTGRPAARGRAEDRRLDRDHQAGRASRCAASSAGELAVFPPPVLDVADTFFSPAGAGHAGAARAGATSASARTASGSSRPRSGSPRSCCSPGRRCSTGTAQPADPYMTLVGYFNATRELAGMRRYLDDDVTTRVRRHGRRKGLSDRIVGTADARRSHELTSRISSGDISEVLKRLEIGFDPELDTSAGGGRSPTTCGRR